MARMIPAAPMPDCASEGELDLFRRLQTEAGTESWVVLHSLGIAAHRRAAGGEADFVVIVPGGGILIVEVKACRSLRYEAGAWYYGPEARPDRRGPFRQAAEAMWSLRSWLVERQPELARATFAHAVVFPYCPCAVESPEWHPWQLIDETSYRGRPVAPLLLEVLRRTAERFARSHAGPPWSPTPADADAIGTLLRPRFETYESPRSRALHLEEELRRYTEAQLHVLDLLEANLRLLVEGPAGTGKTLLAIEASRRAALLPPAQGAEPAHPRVLLVCFNSLLASWLRQQVEPLAPAVQASTFHRYLLDVCGLASAPHDADRAFWEDELPRRAADLLRTGRAATARFDALVVDEAQDLTLPQFLDVLDLSLKGGLARGRWSAFGDLERQSIYGAPSEVRSAWEQRLAPMAARATLRDNCRNTPRMVELVHLLGRLSPGYSRILRPDDGRAHQILFHHGEDEQHEHLAASLKALRSEGFAAHEIVVLSPRSSDACAASQLSAGPPSGFLAPFDRPARGAARFGSIHAFKGMEAPVVILTDIDEILGSKASALFYVGITRTTGRLVILADVRVKQQLARILCGETDDE